jgi:hypothetical protein
VSPQGGDGPRTLGIVRAERVGAEEAPQKTRFRSALRQAHIWLAMSDPTESGALRARANALRTLAGRLDHSLLIELVRAGGDDTWRGPTAAAFQSDARRAERQCDDAAALLRAAARSLEAQAEAAARRQ